MVKVIGFKQAQKEDGTVFNKLQLQGGAEMVQSQDSKKFYLTARSTYISTTFDEATAMSLIGSEMAGTIEKVEVAPYQYTVKDTGQVITLTHSWEYSPIEPANQIVQKKRDDLVVTEESGW